MQQMLTKVIDYPYKKRTKNPYDWTKQENRDKAHFRLWVSYRKALCSEFTGDRDVNTKVYYGYYNLKDFGYKKLMRIIEKQTSAIFCAKIYNNQTNVLVHEYRSNPK